MNDNPNGQDAGLAGMLAGSPFKQKFPFDFIVGGDGEVTVEIGEK